MAAENEITDDASEITDDASTKPSRRKRWIAGASVAAAAVGGAVIVVMRSKSGPSARSTFETAVVLAQAAAESRRPLDHQVPVRTYSRMQPYGPGRTERKPVVIAAHTRGPAQAA